MIIKLQNIPHKISGTVKLSFVILLSLASHAFADETFYLKASENTVTAAISKSEISRVTFNSEIESVHSLKGELEYEIVGKDLYLRAFVDKPINFFVKTFSGKTYKLITTPENIAATQVFIRTEAIKTKQPCKNKERQK